MHARWHARLVSAVAAALAVAGAPARPAGMGGTPAGAAVHARAHAPRAQAAQFGVASAELEGVSCPTGTTCMAVGWQANASGTTRALAERWASGGWQIVKSANPVGSKLVSV